MGVEAGFAGPLPVVLAAPAGEGDEHGSRRPVIPAQGSGDLVAVHAGEADVEKDEVGLKIASGDEGVGAVVDGASFVAEEV